MNFKYVERRVDGNPKFQMRNIVSSSNLFSSFPATRYQIWSPLLPPSAQDETFQELVLIVFPHLQAWAAGMLVSSLFELGHCNLFWPSKFLILLNFSVSCLSTGRISLTKSMPKRSRCRLRIRMDCYFCLFDLDLHVVDTSLP